MRLLFVVVLVAGCASLSPQVDEPIAPPDPETEALQSERDTSDSAPSVTSLADPQDGEVLSSPELPYAFPVVPAERASYSPTHHTYPATDIFAPCGAMFVAVTHGRISEVRHEDAWDPAVDDPATRGGLFVSLVGDDGVRYYGSHLRSTAERLAAGHRVSAGDPLGEVGDTGNAQGKDCHVHFGLSPDCGVGDWEIRRGVVWPAPYLDAWRSGEAASPAVEVANWRTMNSTHCSSH